MNYLKNRSKAFGFAFSGLGAAFKSEINLQLQLFIAVMVIAAGFFFSISNQEWIVILFCIALVLALEMFNSAIEKLCDLFHAVLVAYKNNVMRDLFRPEV